MQRCTGSEAARFLGSAPMLYASIYSAVTTVTVFKDVARRALDASETLIGAGDELTPNLTSRSR